MKAKKSKAVNAFIIGTFVSLYLLVSIISTIHVVDFFRLSNPEWLAISLAIGFELGAAASLAALITLDRMNKTIVWGLFIIITAMQMQGNMYYAYTHIKDYQGWVELFNLIEWEPIAQKRLLAGVSGAILPIVALGFIKSLVDYIKPEDKIEEVGHLVQPSVQPEPELEEQVESMRKVVESYDDLQEEMDDWDVTLLDGLEDEEDLINFHEDWDPVKEEVEEFNGFIPDNNYNTEEEVQLSDYPPIEVDRININEDSGLVNNTGETRKVNDSENMMVYDNVHTHNWIPIKK